MKFIVSSSYLLKKLQVFGGVINNNNTMPILDNFLFEAILYVAYTNLIGRTNNEWLYSGSTVALQWLYSGSTVALQRTKDER